MTFTGGAADHQHTQGEKPRKFFPNRINQPLCPARNSFYQILLHKKERLDAAYLAGEIAQDQVLIFEIIGQCFLDDSVEAMVFAAVVKGAGPVFILLKLVRRDDGSGAVFKSKRRHLSRTVRNRALRRFFRSRHFDAHDSAAEIHIALRTWNLDARFAQLLRHSEIQIAPKAARAITHFLTPNHQFKVDRAFAEGLQKYRWLRLCQHVRIFSRDFEQGIPYFLQIAAIGDTNRNAKTDARIAISPVCHRRINEFRVRHDHGDVVVGQNNGAARTNLLHLTGDTGHLYPIADRNRTLRQNDQAANEIAGDVLQSEANPHADRAGKNGEGPEMNAGIVQYDKNANDQDDVTDDLRNGVLQRAIQPAVYQEAVKQKCFGARRYPEDSQEQGNEQENLNESKRKAGQRLIPRQRNTRSVDGGDREKDEGGESENRRDNRGKIFPELESGKQAPELFALKNLGERQSNSEKDSERNQTLGGDIIAADPK